MSRSIIRSFLIIAIVILSLFLIYELTIGVYDTNSFKNLIARSNENSSITSSEAKPYLDAFSKNDDIVRADAIKIINNCIENDKSCYIKEIYSYTINNLKYVPDPMDAEKIQSYNYTKKVGAGDCEDLSIFVGSLLLNVGVKTYFVMTTNHGYILACDTKLDNELLGRQSSSFKTQIKLPASSVQFVDLNYPIESENLEMNYNIKSNRLVSVYVISSKEEYSKYLSEKAFSYYSECSFQKDADVTKKCNIDNIAGFIIKNEFNGETTVSINAVVSQTKKGEVTVYDIEGRQCIVLDATAGKDSYPGYEGKVQGEKYAFDINSGEIYQLET